MPWSLLKARKPLVVWPWDQMWGWKRTADSALQSQDNLLGRLGLLVEDGLCLTSVTGLLAVITPLSLCCSSSIVRYRVSTFAR